jgi:hypothetical protein
MRLQSETIVAFISLIAGALATVIIFNIIFPNLNIINPSGQEISRSLELNFQLLDYFITNNTLYAYVKPSEPVNYSQVFAIVNNRLVNVYPYNSNGSIVNPYDNGLLIIVANLSQIPPDQNGNYKLEVGLENDILGIFDIKYISNSLINYFQPPIIFNISNSTSSTPTCQVSYLPLILYNTQNIPTPSPFQQDIAICNGSINIGNSFAYINNATLFNQINRNGSNIYFTTTCNSTPNIYSWYEGQLINGSTYCDVWWINLPNGIPANSNVTIYIYIGNSSDNYYSQYYPYVGEAPYLSSTYGQYDNGNYIFLLYNNGTHLFPLNNIGSGGSESLTTNAPSPWNYALQLSVNGGTASANTWTTSGINQTSNPSFNLSNSYIAQTLVYITGSSPLIDLLTNVQSITSGQFYVFRFDARGNYYDGIGYYPSGATATTFLNYTSISSSTGVWYMLTAIDNNDYLYLYKNIVSSYSSYNLAYYGNLEASTKGVGYIGGGIAVTTDGATSTDYFTMMIVRAYPPNGVMPSIYIG